MNIPKISFSGVGVCNAPSKSQSTSFLNQPTTDTYCFSYSTSQDPRERVISDAKELKTLMENHYQEVKDKDTLNFTNVQTFCTDNDENTDYMTLAEEKDKNGVVTGKSAVFKNGKISGIRTYKTNGGMFLGQEIFGFDEKTGELKKYQAETRDEYFGKTSSSYERTKTEYVF